MMFNDVMVNAVHLKRIVIVTFNSHEKGVITRLCIPFDIGPSRKYKDGLERFHFYDLDSPDGSHNLSILPGQITNLEMLNDSFDPKNYVTWSPIKWFIERDWGIYS